MVSKAHLEMQRSLLWEHEFDSQYPEKSWVQRSTLGKLASGKHPSVGRSQGPLAGQPSLIFKLQAGERFCLKVDEPEEQHLKLTFDLHVHPHLHIHLHREKTEREWKGRGFSRAAHAVRIVRGSLPGHNRNLQSPESLIFQPAITI